MDEGLAVGTELCSVLEWDSNHFGIRIGRVNATHLSLESVGRIEEWARQNQIQCLYFLADPESGTMRLAGDAGFRFVNPRVTLDLDLASVRPAAPPTTIRHASADDIPVLKNIAAASHTDSRFYLDDRFPRPLCDDLYSRWIELEVTHAGAVLVAKGERHAAGYVSCHVDGAAGEIGLFAVSEEARGRRLGRDLMDAACVWFAGHGVTRVTVVTQGTNVRAQRTYQRRGFLIGKVELWYHRWFR